MITLSNLYNKLNSFEYVSFDVFDTLLFRAVSDYRLVFDIVALKYYEKYKKNINNFKNIRIQAESQVRKRSEGREITLEMIYDNISLDNIAKKRLMDIECNVEVDICIPNTLMIEVLNWCKINKKKIVIITDMYLPRTVFERLFYKFGISYDYMFISGEEGVTKRSGLLFNVVIDKMSIKPSQIIHIGDDKNNDIEQPRKYGINSIERIYKWNLAKTYLHSIKSSIVKDQLNTIFSKYVCPDNDNIVPWRLGFTLIGPMMFEFCEWIHKQKEEKNLDKLLFVAREGYLIKKCYDILYPNDDTDYIRLNKNLLRLPLLNLNNPLKYFDRAKLGRQIYTWKLIFDLLYIKDIKQIVSLMKEKFPDLNISESIDIHDLTNGKYNDVLLQLFEFQKERINEQALCLDEYLSEFRFDENRIGLVNNSINGNGQSMLEDYLSYKNMNHNIIGLQFIASKKCLSVLNDRFKAWLDDLKCGNYTKSIFHRYCLIFEHLLFEPIGTSLYLIRKTDSKVDVVCEKARGEAMDFQKIECLQNFAIEFVKTYKNMVKLPFNGISLKMWYDMLTSPIKEDAIYICNLHDDDMDGDNLLTDINIPFKYVYILSAKKAQCIRWKEGYLCSNLRSKSICEMYKFIDKCRYFKSKILK